MYTVQPGPANQSYGLHVARLAGVPYEVLVNARVKLKELEDAYHDAMSGNNTAGQLSLFKTQTDAPSTTPCNIKGDIKGNLTRSETLGSDLTQGRDEPDSEQCSNEAFVIDELRRTTPDDLSPRDALKLLYELHDQLNTD